VFVQRIIHWVGPPPMLTRHATPWKSRQRNLGPQPKYINFALFGRFVILYTYLLSVQSLSTKTWLSYCLANIVKSPSLLVTKHVILRRIKLGKGLSHCPDYCAGSPTVFSVRG
jgi:hypothetical protein